MAIFRRDPLTGASNAGGVSTNRDSGRIAGYQSMTAIMNVRATVTDDRAVYRTDSDASVNLCLSQPAEYAKEKRR